MTVNGWPKVPLGEILIQSGQLTEIQPDKQYRQVTVRLWGQGVVLRAEVSGAAIASKQMYVVHSQQFLLSRIDARNGAFGLVPEFLDGAVVSNDFPSFDLDLERIDPRFLGWMSKTRWFIDLCQAASEGTTNRVRLKVDRFLATTVPLPALSEQRRIVARIEELAAKIEEARGLREKAISLCDSLGQSIISDTSGGAPIPTRMQELVKLREPDVVVAGEEVYHFAGVYCFGKGVFKGQRRAGVEFSYKRLTKLRTNNFVYPKLMAWEGALGVVPPECEGLVVSPEFPVFEVDESRVLPEVLDVHFRTPSVWPLLSSISTGTNVRRRRLQPSDFLAYQMPLPPMHTQQRLHETMSKMDAIRRLQAETSAELDALLPSVLDRALKGDL